MSSKKPEGIPVASLISSKGFKRNYDIEFKEALDETLHRDAVAGGKHKATQREKAQQPRKGHRTLEIVEQAARGLPDGTLEEIYPHVQSALADEEPPRMISKKH
jgi:hypothetical protein